MRELLNLAVRLVEEAAAVITAVRAAGFAVDAKADATPVTVADMRAEALIVAGLRAAAPEIPVIAEEEVAAGSYHRAIRPLLAGGPAGRHAGIRRRAR